MAKLITKSKVTIFATFSVDEEELRALDAMVGYGFKSFLNVFTLKLGESYLGPHVKGLERFFETIQGVANSALHDVDEARKAAREQDAARRRAEIKRQADAEAGGE